MLRTEVISGHWERDTMHGAERKGGLLVCVERKYRYVRLTKLLRRTAEKTAMATIRLLRDFPVRTITNDRALLHVKRLYLKPNKQISGQK